MTYPVPGASSVPTVDEWWDVDGVPLATHAWNVTMWGASRQSPPPLRGSDLVIPYVPGQRWVPKQPDSKIITLAGWVLGCDDKGNVPFDQIQQFRQNWYALRRLLWQPYRQLALTRRWYEPGDALGAPHVATAQAQFTQGLEPSSASSNSGMTYTGVPSRATFTVDLKLADPFFYGPQVPNYRLDLVNHPYVVVPSLGDVESRLAKVYFVGPLTTPILSTATLGHVLAVDATVPAGQVVALDVAAWTALQGTAAAGVPKVFTGAASSVLKSVVSSFQSALFGLGPFSDEVTLATSSGADTGYVLIDVQPAWS